MNFIKRFFRKLFRLEENLRYRDQDLHLSRILEHFASVCLVTSAIYYFTWLIKNMRWEHWYVGIAFLISELAFFLLLLIWVNILWKKRFHRPEGPPLKLKKYSVDIFIPVCGEPIKLIEKTIFAAQKLNWKWKTVYVLDDGKDDKVLAPMRKDRCGIH